MDKKREKGIPFFEAVSSYSFWRSNNVKGTTVESYQRMLAHFGIFIQNKDLQDIVWQDVSKYFELMKKAGYMQNTLIPIAIALRTFLEFYRKQNVDCLDPEMIPIPHKEYTQPRVITDEHYKKLIDVIPINNDPRHVRNLAIIKLLRDTGARFGEILSLDVDDIQYRKAVIKTEKSKGKRPFRQIFWSEDTQQHLEKWLERRKHLESLMDFKAPRALFISISYRNGERFTIKGGGEMLRRYSHEAKIPVINAHSFRHRIGHDIINKGGSAADVMNILGHATLASSSVYVQMYGEEVENRYRELLDMK